MPSRSKLLGLCLAAVMAVSPVSAAGAGEGEREAPRYCVVHVDDPGSEQCFATPEALSDAVTFPSSASSVEAVATSYIATHYDGNNFAGSYINVAGSSCTGGVWVPTGWWDNRINSTRNYCGGPSITHYDSSSCSGTNIVLSNSSNLGWMSDRTSCVRYG